MDLTKFDGVDGTPWDFDGEAAHRKALNRIDDRDPGILLVSRVAATLRRCRGGTIHA